MPGPIDHETGTVRRSLVLEWGRTPLKEMVTQAFDLPTIVENDAVAAAAGEWNFGHAKRIGEAMVYVTIGRGIGAGVVDGKILRGAHNRLGAIGHTTISLDSPVKCHCGNPGCLEAFVGRQAIIAMAHERRIVSTKEESEALGQLLAAIDAHKPEALDLIAQVPRYLAVDINNLILMLDPAAVIIGSPLAQHPVFIESVQYQLAELNSTIAPFVDICASTLCPDASLKGAYAIAFQDFVGASPQHLAAPSA